MENLFEWIRNIAYYLIFITVVSNLLPNKKYEKYIRFFAGMVLILLVLKPVTGGLRLENTMAYYFESISIKKEAGELKGEISAMEDKRLKTLISGYEEAVETDLASMAETSGFGWKEIRAEIDRDQESSTFCHVLKVFMILTVKEEAGETGGVVPVEKVERVEEVKITEQETRRSEERRQEENLQLSGLRRRIGEYYDLEEQDIEIQVEDGKG
ncbi:MAG: stage III sporulation protein AF [Lacrimispora sp.]|uniref:stage III sporulation protein AF n=1 Tax=Lacrimispora sp. TaxID=2719234 RepID=UPI0039E35905